MAGTSPAMTQKLAPCKPALFGEKGVIHCSPASAVLASVRTVALSH